GARGRGGRRRRARRDRVLARGTAPVVDGAADLAGRPAAGRGPLPADLPPVRRVAGGGPPRLPGGRAPPAPLPRQPAVLGGAAFLQQNLGFDRQRLDVIRISV